MCIYSLFPYWNDSFLLPNYNFAQSYLTTHSKEKCKEEYALKKLFHSFMEEVPAFSEYNDINNKSQFNSLRDKTDFFYEKFYRLKEEYKSLIDLRLGDIMSVGKYNKKGPVGAIFFRNAMYHLCQNNINEVFDYSERPKMAINKKDALKDLVRGIHKTLDLNGIFIIGNHIKEHLFWADNSTLPSEKILFCETPFFNSLSKKHLKCKNIMCYKTSPLVQVLEKKFEPVFYSKVNFFGKNISVPVIWKKIRL